MEVQIFMALPPLRTVQIRWSQAHLLVSFFVLFNSAPRALKSRLENSVGFGKSSHGIVSIRGQDLKISVRGILIFANGGLSASVLQTRYPPC